MHKGHQFLLSTLCREAEKRGLQPLVVVIDKPSTHRLTTPDEQDALLSQYTSHITHYTLDDIRHLSALEFLSTLNAKHATINALLMGYDHRFGADQLNFAQLQSSISNQQFEVISCPSTDAPISSSKIRAALENGDVETANNMLGYPYTLTGTVVRGNGIGHTIGFPTANIQPDSRKLIPKPGVYAAENALVNIGTNPTVGNDHLTIEAYLPNYQGPDFYDQILSLRLTRRLRDEHHFSSLSALQSQIQQDLTQL